MKLKLDADGHVVVADGKPVYTHDDGKDLPFDAPASVAKIGQLNGEAMGHRQAKEAAEAKIAAFEGLDLEAAKKALETVSNLDQGKLLEAGKVEDIKAAAAKAAEERVAAAQRAAEQQVALVTGERDTLKKQLDGALIGGAFKGSKFIPEKTVVPTDMLQAMFGSNFKVEDGKVVAIGSDGKQLFSRAKPGEIADFEEALELLVDGYSFKDNILKGTVGAGGGAGNGGGGTGGKKTITRAEFDKLDATTKQNTMRDVNAGKAALVD